VSVAAFAVVAAVRDAFAVRMLPERNRSPLQRTKDLNNPMGFDKNDPRPIIEPARRTTKVNISIAVAVVVFLAIGAVAIAVYAHSHH